MGCGLWAVGYHGQCLLSVVCCLLTYHKTDNTRNIFHINEIAQLLSVGEVRFIWNKTAFGKNMFAVGSNPEAANVSGVNVTLTIILVFMLAGVMYGITGFIEAARIGSNTAATGLNYELDAIAACVIGGVSFVGGIGKIRGVITGVVLLRIIFVGLTFLGIDSNMQYVIKGLIILIACALDMRKYLVRK